MVIIEKYKKQRKESIMYAYKVEIQPTERQKQLIHQNIGVCRFVYNTYISYNQEIYEKEKRFVSAIDYDKHINAVVKKELPWIKTCNTKARKQSLFNAEKAYKNFFTGKSKFPRFKKKNKQDVKVYLPKNNATDFAIERHRAKMPLLGYVRLKEKGYIPEGLAVSSCTISQKGNRYYVSFLTKAAKQIPIPLMKKGVGMDVGLKEFAVCSNKKRFSNINRSRTIRRLEITLQRKQRALSRKLEAKKKRKQKNENEWGANIKKNILVIQKLYQKLQNIRHAYLRHVITEVVKTKPQYITIEDLHIKGMMKNKYLSRHIGNQNFYCFRTFLEQTCRKYGIELRMVDRWYPSSKTCFQCKNKKTNLSLSERTFSCKCGYKEDRDMNAALNLEHATEYTVLVG